jgi:hypothetical protein
MASSDSHKIEAETSGSVAEKENRGGTIMDSWKKSHRKQSS